MIVETSRSMLPDSNGDLTPRFGIYYRYNPTPDSSPMLILEDIWNRLNGSVYNLTQRL